MAKRRGFRLTKSRRRDPGALEYGRWGLVHIDTGLVAPVDDPIGRGFPFDDLDEVEAWLTSEERP